MIHRIDRPDDPRIAPFSDVARPDRLRASGLFVAEGRLVVRRLLELRRFEIQSVLVTPAALADMAAEFESSAWPVYVAEPRLLQHVTGFDFHRGCLALARRASPVPLDRFTGARRLLALEGVGNPDNVGGLFRVAAAFGLDGIVLSSTCGDPYYRKAIRTSMGAVLRVPFNTAECWPGDLQRLRAAGLLVVGLTPAASAMPLRDFADTIGPDARVTLACGTEGGGLTPEVLAIADRLVRIPIAGAVDSLNVVVAAGIALGFIDPTH